MSQARENAVSGPLAGVRVVDFTRVLAGPFCTAIMGDLGAEIIKVESPNGDEYRHVPPFREDQGAFFLLVNRGKKSIVLNLKSEEGKAVVAELVRAADVVVENFSPGVADRLGIGYEACNAINPRVIYASISGFGQSGAMARQPAYDVIVQAASGIMHSTGFAGTSPTLAGESLADLIAGLFAAWGVSSALYERERTGAGRYMDVSMFDCLFSMLPTSIAQWLYGGHLPKRVGNRHPISVPFGAFKARDGWFMLAILSNRLFNCFLAMAGQDALIGDPRFASDMARSEHEPLVRGIIEDWAADKDVAEVVAVLSAAHIPAGLIWTIQQAIESDQVRERGLMHDVDHPTAGKATVLEQPVRFRGLARGCASAPPLLGEHTNEILRGICKLSDEQVAALEASGVVLSLATPL